MDSPSVTAKVLSNESHPINRSSFSKKKAVVLSVTLVFAVAAIAGACALALTFAPAGENMSSSHDLSLQDKEKLHSMVVADNEMATIARRQRGVKNTRKTRQCYSQITNESIPIAHLSGTATRGFEWSNTQYYQAEGMLPMNVYQTTWDCKEPQDAIAGGMNFSKDSSELIFPVCGYYYFSSQVLFKYMDDNSNNQHGNAMFGAHHIVQINSNCGLHTQVFNRNSYSSITERNYQRTTSYLSDVVKMCAGGTIKILIPVRDSRCCAYGGVTDSFFSSFLIQKTFCN